MIHRGGLMQQVLEASAAQQGEEKGKEGGREGGSTARKREREGRSGRKEGEGGREEKRQHKNKARHDFLKLCRLRPSLPRSLPPSLPPCLPPSFGSSRHCVCSSPIFASSPSLPPSLNIIFFFFFFFSFGSLRSVTYCCQLAVQLAERDVHRADCLAGVAAHAAAGQVKGAHDVEKVLFGQFQGDAGPVRVDLLGDALKAVAARAGLAAGIAADAAVELAAPSRPAVRPASRRPSRQCRHSRPGRSGPRSARPTRSARHRSPARAPGRTGRPAAARRRSRCRRRSGRSP